MQINMLSLSDLKNYDVKNIDATKLLRNLQSRRDILINLVVLVATLFAIAKIYENRTIAARTLNTQIKALEEKVKAIVAYEDSKAKLDQFIATLPTGLGGPSEIVEKINSLAIMHNIQIFSLAPSTTTAADTYSKIIFRLSVAAPKYEDLGQFVADIENGKHNLRVDRWTASINEPLSRERRPEEQSAKQITAEMEIAAYTFKK